MLSMFCAGFNLGMTLLCIVADLPDLALIANLSAMIFNLIIVMVAK